jgi:hypothetical protein
MKEIESIGNLREEVKEGVVRMFSEYLEKDADTSVSEAQIEAYKLVVDAIPEGKLKDFAEKMESLQRTSSKLNETYFAIQDKTWQLARAVVIARLPLAALIPEKPFSKIAIKSAKLGGMVSEKIARTVFRKKD